MANDSHRRAELAVIRAVGRLYKSQPGVKRFTMKRRKGVFVRAGWTWYREPWMDDMLNAYAKLKGKNQ